VFRKILRINSDFVPDSINRLASVMDGEHVCEVRSNFKILHNTFQAWKV